MMQEELYDLDPSLVGILEDVRRRFDDGDENVARMTVRQLLKAALGRSAPSREALEVRRRLDEIAPGLSAELDMTGL